jgi:hypothetical protein
MENVELRTSGTLACDWIGTELQETLKRDLTIAPSIRKTESAEDSETFGARAQIASHRSQTACLNALEVRQPGSN